MTQLQLANVSQKAFDDARKQGLSVFKAGRIAIDAVKLAVQPGHDCPQKESK